MVMMGSMGMMGMNGAWLRFLSHATMVSFFFFIIRIIPRAFVLLFWMNICQSVQSSCGSHPSNTRATGWRRGGPHS